MFIILCFNIIIAVISEEVSIKLNESVSDDLSFIGLLEFYKRGNRKLICMVRPVVDMLTNVMVTWSLVHSFIHSFIHSFDNVGSCAYIAISNNVCCSHEVIRR